MKYTLFLNGKEIPLQHIGDNDDEIILEPINCVCKEDWTDGTNYCQECGLKRITEKQ